MALVLKPLCNGLYKHVLDRFLTKPLNAALIDGRRGLSEKELIDSCDKSDRYSVMIPNCIKVGLANGQLLKRGQKIALAKGATEPKHMQNVGDGFARATDCPAEVLTTVLSFLDARTLGAAATAGRALPRADVATWRNLAQNHYPMTRTLDDVADWRTVYRAYSLNFVSNGYPRPKAPAVPGIDTYTVRFELWNDYPHGNDRTATMLLQSGTMRPVAECVFGTHVVGSDEDIEMHAEFEVEVSEELKSIMSLEQGDLWARVVITRRDTRPGRAGIFVCYNDWITNFNVTNLGAFCLGMSKPLDIRRDNPEPGELNGKLPATFCGLTLGDGGLPKLIKIGFSWVYFDEGGECREYEDDIENVTPGELLQLLHRAAYFD